MRIESHRNEKNQYRRGQTTHKMIEFKIKSYDEHNFVFVEMYNHQTGTNTTFFHNKSELKGLADFLYKTIGDK
jgi:hypothetical protein